MQGSHIAVKRLYDHDRCYIFQNRDGRVIFAIPYEGDFTLIGTTDRDYPGDPGKAQIGSDEIDYLCRTASEYFRAPVMRDAIVWSYSGVRPLYDDGASKAQETTREYVLMLDGDAASGAGPQYLWRQDHHLATFGRRAMKKIERVLGRRGPAWTSGSHLPGGDFAVDGFEALAASLSAQAPRVVPKTIARLARAYGTEAQGHPDRRRPGRYYRRRSGRAAKWISLSKKNGPRAPMNSLAALKLGLRFSAAEEEALARHLEGARINSHECEGSMAVLFWRWIKARPRRAPWSFDGAL